MLEPGYRIVFQGETEDGFDGEEVKAALTRLFSLNAETAKKMFGSGRVIIKSNLTASQVESYRKVLTGAGAKIHVEPMDERMPPFPDQPVQAEMPEAVVPPEPPKTGVPVQDDPSPLHPIAETRRLFDFTGTGGEFLKIWIVNLLLSIVTLGIYSAWAKVRTRRYFYGNTRLDGASFEYRASPVAILKGRLIALGFFIVYSVLSRYAPVAAIGLMFVFLLFFPWLLVKSLAFNARNSAYRNVCFGFDGKVWDAFKMFVLWPIAGTLTLGALIPLSFYKQQRYIVENSRYGTQTFRFETTARPYYMIFLKSFIFLILSICIAIGIGALLSVSGINAQVIGSLAVIPFLFVYFFLFIYFNVKVFNLRYNSTRLSSHGFSSSLQLGSYSMLVITNTLGILFTLGLFHPWAQVRSARYKASRFELLANGEIGTFVAAEEKEVSAIGQEMGDVFDFEISI